MTLNTTYLGPHNWA